jgi:excisionase family DNA binding protein
MERYTVTEAAQVLGVGTDAIRKRIQRDTIEHERVDGTVYVWLDTDEPRHDSGVTEDLIEAYKDQLASYKDQVEFLRRELERKDTIIMTMASRIPELEPASEPRESPVTDVEASEKGEQQQPLSWWQRLFKG